MTRKTTIEIACGAIVTGVFGLAFAAPALAATANPSSDACSVDQAAAQRAHPGGPITPCDEPTDPAAAPVATDGGTEWQVAQVAVGVVGGLALSGAGVAGAAGIRRRNHRTARS